MTAFDEAPSSYAPASQGVARPATVSATSQLVPGSGIREILDVALSSGREILHLELGEPDFRTPAYIVAAAQRAAAEGVSYTQSAGSLALREVLATKVAVRSGLPCAPADVVVTQGGVQGCALAFSALLSAGDEVLIPDPAWPNFEMLALLNGASPVRYPLHPETGFLPDPGEIARMIGSRTRLIVLNSPSNPTGSVFPPELVRAIVELAQRRGLVVLSDEVYEDLIFAGGPANARAFDPARVVAVYSLSKTYAMTGWRVGYLAAPSWLSPTLIRLQEAQLSCVSAVSQAAALAAVTGPQDEVIAMREAYRSRRDLVLRLCAEHGLSVTAPNGAFYLMFPLGPGVDSRAFALRLIGDGVAVAPGSAFGAVGQNHLRISLATAETVLAEAVSRLLARHQDLR
jgi:aspartate aminotransferase